MKSYKLILVLSLIIYLSSCINEANNENGLFNKEVSNEKIIFDFGWKFTRSDVPGSEATKFDDSLWEDVDLPHDWSIEGPFSKENPSFSRGAWLPTGKCTYRKSFHIAENRKGKRFVIYFDGAYRNSEVWINGHLLGSRPLGYIAFAYDLSEHINYGGENTFTVKLDNSNQPGSRWYTGTGIYRHVHLITSDKLYIPIWGTYIVANNFTKEEALLHIETKVKNDFEEEKTISVVHTAINLSGEAVSKTTSEHVIPVGSESLLKTELNISKPQLWSPNSPHLYTIKTDLLVNNKVVYSENNTTGIRKLEFDNEYGFKINGETVKLKGVCLHHDGGPLGSAIYERTIERQLEILSEMGCNAVRTAHNPFSEEFMNVCDRMGFLVMNEMFDEWEIPKAPATTQGGKKIRIPIDYYASQFKEWADKDLTDFILRDRNHPSVIMWSIGNEIDQMMDDEGAPLAQHLADIVRSLDYRPVTNGVFGYGWDDWPSDKAVATSDIKGYNYIKDAGFEKERTLFPDAMAIVTECESAQSFYPRGTYLYGEEKNVWWEKLNYRDQEAFVWADSRGILGENGIEAWRAVKKRPYVMGQFIWTGWDYLGEVIPFGWPARSSSFAPIDLAGFPKDGFYFYQSQWSDEPMVHIFPHWNFEGSEGDTITVHAFTNCDEAELFQDGKSLGKQQNNTEGVEYQSWNVVYKPGEIRAAAYKQGEIIAEKTIRTAGAPAKIKLITRRNKMSANAQDLIYIECQVLDKDDNLVPRADNLISFEIVGPGKISGVGNGNNMSHESFKTDFRKAFNGKCLAIVQSTSMAGEIHFTAKSEGLTSAVIELTSR